MLSKFKRRTSSTELFCFTSNQHRNSTISFSHFSAFQTELTPLTTSQHYGCNIYLDHPCQLLHSSRMINTFASFKALRMSQHAVLIGAALRKLQMLSYIQKSSRSKGSLSRKQAALLETGRQKLRQLSIALTPRNATHKAATVA